MYDSQVPINIIFMSVLIVIPLGMGDTSQTSGLALRLGDSAQTRGEIR